MRQGQFITGDDSHVSRRFAWKDRVLEKAIVKVIRQSLVACRIPHWLILARTPCAKCGTWSVEPPDKGIPDIAGIIPPSLFPELTPAWGRPLFIEVKRPVGGHEEIHQTVFLEERRKQGAIALFARGWDEVAGALQAAGVWLPEPMRAPEPK